MKKLLFLPIISLLLLAGACSTKIDLNGTWQDVTVVYGLLNQKDTFTYLKINKAFLGEGNMLTMAAEPDSSSYGNNLDVKIEQYSPEGWFVDSFHFDTTSVYHKEPGTFYYPKQIIYKALTNNKLKEENSFKLIITNKKTKKVVTSTATLVHAVFMTKPLSSMKYVDFNQPTGLSSWKSAQNGRRYQLTIRFHYMEVMQGTTDSTNGARSLDWVFGDMKSMDILGGTQMDMSYIPTFFYNNLKSKIAALPAGFIRVAGKVDYILGVAHEDFSTYLDVSEPSTGLVQERPDFTNIYCPTNNTKEIGIFSSRYQVSNSYKLASTNIDMLKTMGLGFVK